MSNVGQSERATQNRVIALFRDELHYRYLGDWIDRDDNSNIEEEVLTAYLNKRGYTSAQISAALYKLRTEADNHSRNLYGNNQAVYNLLRYGVPVKIEAGKSRKRFTSSSGRNRRRMTSPSPRKLPYAATTSDGPT